MDPETKVDREWLSKLVAKHQSTGNNESASPSKISLIRNDPILKNKILAVAPMINQSDRAFRLLCRNYNANLTYTPMIHASYFIRKASYRKKMHSPSNDGGCHDRPLIAQIGGRNKETLLQCAKILLESGDVDAIDLNCGCPTLTAKRGGYGAWLLQNGDHVVGIVRYLAENLSCPVTVKVRLLSTPGGDEAWEDSLALYERLVDAGAAMICFHGRTRLQKGSVTGAADWDAMKSVVERLGRRVPVLVNGGIATLDDVRECLAYTGADGVVSSESVLEYPPLFTETQTCKVGGKRTGPGRVALAGEYLKLCRRFPPEEGGGGAALQCIRMHLEVMLYEDWQHYPDLESVFRTAANASTFETIVDEIMKRQNKRGHIVEEERLTWYMRHRLNSEDEI
eukprot:CAMPEP_0171308418 /NCGR_PEP_ID=MMETSP0816-20121228/18576_1 /TAXON_ID=420281 /ORGANISM="Proboscia inermis, Strain CCAP1064/1" /LENGTH=395 /DNA_ID=CAMNT_0011791327 /DNA_START=64 /DNA_END=1251 /DNA_ORIENTATION=+